MQQKTKARGARAGGYTLIEAVMLMLVLAVIAAPTSYVIIESMKVYASTAPTLDATYQASLAVEALRRDVREMRSPATITAATPTRLAFQDAAGEPVVYDLAGGDLTRNGDLLARGVTSLNLSYWDAAGAPATSPELFTLLEIDLTVTSAGRQRRLTTLAYPRMLGP